MKYTWINAQWKVLTINNDSIQKPFKFAITISGKLIWKKLILRKLKTWKIIVFLLQFHFFAWFVNETFLVYKNREKICKGNSE